MRSHVPSSGTRLEPVCLSMHRRPALTRMLQPFEQPCKHNLCACLPCQKYCIKHLNLLCIMQIHFAIGMLGHTKNAECLLKRPATKLCGESMQVTLISEGVGDHVKKQPLCIPTSPLQQNGFNEPPRIVLAVRHGDLMLTGSSCHSGDSVKSSSSSR